MPTICVAYLLRSGNPVSCLTDFIDSYKAHPTGVKHDVLVIGKGFTRSLWSSSRERSLVADGIEHGVIFVSDIGYDTRSYVLAAERTAYDHYLFLNSFSVILDDEWLAKLARHALSPAAGLVGATASYASHYDNLKMVPPIREVVPCAGIPVRVPGVIRRFHGTVVRRTHLWCRSFSHPPYPNPHIRTNAFMISRDVLLGATRGPMLTKEGTYRFESGRHGLTAQVLRKGLRALVVGRDGIGYDVGDWPSSNTCWQHGQENLIVADNQTRRYDNASPEERERMGISAWGAAYRPYRPPPQT